MKSQKRIDSSPGFIVLLTLMIISIMVLIVTQFANRSIIHWYFDQTMIEREQAKHAALSGIQIALSLLAPPPPEKEGSAKQDASAQKAPDLQQHILTTVMPSLNRWQTFDLKENLDGVNATIRLCISCEEGKININKLFDFQKHSFLPVANNSDPKKIIGVITNALRAQGAKKQIDEAFEKFLKQRNFIFNDATELVTLPELPSIYKNNLFYAPPLQQTDKKPSQQLFLMDLFTVWSDQLKLNPWLLSDSVCALLGLKRAGASNDLQDRMQAAKLLKDLKTGSSLKERWDAVGQKLYGRDFASLNKEIASLMDENVRAKNFSVLSYGSVGAITQRVVAIIAQESAQKFVIKKLYWI